MNTKEQAIFISNNLTIKEQCVQCIEECNDIGGCSCFIGDEKENVKH